MLCHINHHLWSGHTMRQRIHHRDVAISRVTISRVATSRASSKLHGVSTPEIGSLTLFRPGGGGVRILPAATLDVINVFNIKANSTKLGDFYFLKFIWQQFDITCSCLRELTFPWQPYFARHVFQTFIFSYLKN